LGVWVSSRAGGRHWVNLQQERGKERERVGGREKIKEEGGREGGRDRRLV
jgi:hypothetical protein